MKNVVITLSLLLLCYMSALPEHRGSSALLHAASSGDLQAAKLALSTSDIEGVNTESRTALHMAAKYGNRDVAILLLEAGASTDAVDFQGQTALHLAAAGGHFQLCDLLLAGGSDPNLSDRRGDTPVHSAARGGHDSATRSLLRNGGKAGTTNEQGKTPAELARRARVGSWEQVARQLEKKAVGE